METIICDVKINKPLFENSYLPGVPKQVPTFDGIRSKGF